MNPQDEPFREVPHGDHVWPPILAALAAGSDYHSKFAPYVLSDPPPVEVEGGWYKEKVVAFPPQQKDSDS
jgi:hypothetical protein